MSDLRPYQLTAIEQVQQAWATHPRVLLTIPTGGGKTITGSTLVKLHQGRTLWLTHRRELLTQAAGALRAIGLDVGIISPVHQPDPWAQVQVASMDTLLSRGSRPDASLIVADECHHMAADTYRTLLEAYPDARVLGLTATPQRSDGRALGDLFQRLIVGARYSELIAAGHLVPCRVFRPAEYLGSDLARDPLDAWNGLPRELQGPAFGFARDVAHARALARQFTDAGIPSEVVTGLCGNSKRAAALDGFRSGAIRVLWNVFVLTEGVDVPDARVCLLARGCGHAGTYLQMVGRVLRPAAGKGAAVLLDLPGVSWLHGLPTADREYALDGRPIRCVGESLKNCPQCGACIPSQENPCGECGYLWEREERPRPKIWNLELAEAIEAAGGDVAAVGDEWQRREAQRLLDLCRSKGWDVSWAAREWRKLFGEVATFPVELTTRDELRTALSRLQGLAIERGYKRGWAAYRYKAAFGVWPV